MQALTLFALSTVGVAAVQLWRKAPAAATAAKTGKELKYIPFDLKELPESTVVVDCTHPTCRQLTHHLKLPGQRSLHLDTVSLGADSSTEQVLLAQQKGALEPFEHVSTNHFDVDSFLSVWSACNPQMALGHADVIREAARIGDFRELWLNDTNQEINAVSFKALALVCWLNSEERRLFYKSFESAISRAMGEEESTAKWEYFLPLFANVLADPMNFEAQWKEEYSRVLQEYNQLHSPAPMGSRTQHFPDISLVCVTGDEPMHYYSLFSPSRGYDIVLSLWAGNRYEMEIKYTTYITLFSRPSLPRVEIEELAKVLNSMETVMQGGDVHWFANRIVDSGPLLRLDSTSKHLTKAERYGHPYERPIFSSSIPPDVFKV